jgi:cell division protein FtsW (lipid II flippase)
VSLKGFHVLLISLSALLTLLFAGWSLHAWRATGRGAHLGFALASVAIAVALTVYVVWFARTVRSREEQDRERRRNIRPLALAVAAGAWLAGTRPAAACSVCYGEATGPMIDAARLGVWLLFGLVLAVQLAFVLFFLNLRKRARTPASGLPARAEEWSS